MGDPFSAAASALSVVSVGIQICQGLLIYYDDCKSFDDTVASLCRKVAWLRTTFEKCEEILNSRKRTTSRAHAHVLERINVSGHNLDKLKEALYSCQKHPKPQGFRANFHNYRQQVFFPFRKPHLIKLETAVSALQNDVQIALVILQTLGVLLHTGIKFSLL